MGRVTNLLRPLCQHKDGTLSDSKVRANIAFAVVSVLVARSYWNAPLNAEVLLIYLVTASGHAALSKYLETRVPAKGE